MRMALDCLDDNPSASAAAKGRGQKLSVEAESLRRWVMQARADTGVTPAATEQLAEMSRLKNGDAELPKTNDRSKAVASLMS